MLLLSASGSARRFMDLHGKWEKGGMHIYVYTDRT